MLRQVATGVLIHESTFLQSNTVVVQDGRTGVLIIDPGGRGDEMVCLANDLSDLGQTVVAGFSTHPHWDHLLWHPSLGAAPRYSTARCAASAQVSEPAEARTTRLIPPEIVEEIPLDMLGLIAGLPGETEQIPWDGPDIRILEHQATPCATANPSATLGSGHRPHPTGCLAGTNGNSRASPDESSATGRPD